MRLIKAFLIVSAGLFVIITLFSLLIPSRVRVSRGIQINNTSYGTVYQQIAHFENWKKWHPVFTVDSANLYWRPPAIVGTDSVYSIMHRGMDITIRLISADSTSVKFLLQSAGENDIDNDIVITPLSSSHAVHVEWRAIIKLHWYPWEKFYGIFIDKLTGPDYEGALNGLKDYIEKNPSSLAFKKNSVGIY